MHLLPNGKKNTIQNVSDYFGVSESTLSDRNVGRYSIDNFPKTGRRSVF